jgi:hypothetical protein
MAIDTTSAKETVVNQFESAATPGAVRRPIQGMRGRSRKRPRDLNQLAASIVDEATNDPPKPQDTRGPLAVELGRRGGLKGGKAVIRVVPLLRARGDPQGKS